VKKYAVISTTSDPLYSFFVPIAAWCWGKLGIRTICIIPAVISKAAHFALMKALEINNYGWCATFIAPEDKQATYAQVGRLFAAADGIVDPNDILITSDADMIVFRDVFPDDDYMNILGVDLVPQKQYPVCYISGRVSRWREAMKIKGRTLQECLDAELGPIECENFRGHQWSFDQSLLYRQLSFDQPIAFQNRARPGTQFAMNRADRDDVNWRSYCGPTLLDAHLWRPGYEEPAFSNIVELLTIQYPDEDFEWLFEYHTKYKELL
jgi:hypothetical protein